VFTSITEPLLAFDIGTKKQRRERVKALMRMLGLSLLLGERKPGQLSGGQCQRVAIARAIAISPKLLICDEALVNLDLPQQVEILKLLKRLKKQLQLTILFISHDKDTVNALCSRTLIMKKKGVV
jgi:ABC-type dipeptide/oligopeptide/nickel transport system ATPase subunit